MIAFATPFGSFIAGAFDSTTKSLYDVNSKAFEAIGQPLNNGLYGKIIPDAQYVSIISGGATAQFNSDGTIVIMAEGETMNLTVEDIKIENDKLFIVIDGTEEYIATIAANGKIIEALDTFGSFFVIPEAQNIPAGCFYGNINGDTVNLYDEIPAFVSLNDFYLAGDYLYLCQGGGWTVHLATIEKAQAEGVYEACSTFNYTDRTKTSYGNILDQIGGCPVFELDSTFQGCVNMTKSPALPQFGLWMNFTFEGCSSLVVAPKLPEKVVVLGYNVFAHCTSLTTAPVIPASVGFMEGLFTGCTSLRGQVVINTNNIDSADLDMGCALAFLGVDMRNITLTGDASAEVLNLIGGTGLNYTPIPQ